MNFIEKLKERKKEWDLNSDYKKDAMKEVFDYLLEEDKKRQGKVVYNSELKDLIIEKEKLNLSNADEDYLGTEVYLAQKQLDRKQEKEHEAKMLNDGWLILTEDIAKQAIENKKKILLKTTNSIDWYTYKIEKIVKPIALDGGRYGLLPLRARKKGYYLDQFKKAYCKIVD